jgi:hypothetical protein
LNTRKEPPLKILATIFVGLLLAGCGSQPATPKTENPTNSDVSFARHVQPILTQSCMPCHAGGRDARAGYDLTSYAGVIGGGSASTPYIIPGKADSSKLYQMVRDGRMPPPGKLDSTKLATIEKWIDEGAKDD